MSNVQILAVLKLSCR